MPSPMENHAWLMLISLKNRIETTNLILMLRQFRITPVVKAMALALAVAPALALSLALAAAAVDKRVLSTGINCATKCGCYAELGF